MHSVLRHQAAEEPRSDRLGPAFFHVKDGRSVAWDPSHEAPVGEFYRQVAEHLAKAPVPLRFFFSFWQETPPVVGDDVVVLVVGDERGLFPEFCRDVRAVFKCYGSFPYLCKMRLSTPYANLIIALTFLRNVALWLNHYWKAPGRRSNVFTLPLGFYKDMGTKAPDIDARTIDVFFAGSVRDFSGIRGIVKNQKYLARKRLLRAAAKWNLPGRLQIESLKRAFRDNEGSRPYAEVMRDSKICLCPKGNSPETYRLYEAFQAGCITIVDEYHGGVHASRPPVILADDWNRCAGTIHEILSDKNRLRDLQTQTLAWYRDYWSPEAVARSILEKLSPLPTRS
jgi:hypothetical protein